jgi:prephenate dehydratase
MRKLIGKHGLRLFGGRLSAALYELARKSYTPTLMEDFSPELALTLGPKFSYSEIATRRYLKDIGSTANVVTLTPINRTEGVIEELVRYYEEGKENTIAVVPMYNTTEGRVKDTISPGRGLLKYHRAQIRDEYIMQISHCLAARKKGAKIELVISHNQAVQQCISYIRKLGAKYADTYNGVSVSSTADSARIVAESGRDGIAAICSEEAATHYGLEIVNDGYDVNDKLFAGYSNRTVFVVLCMKSNGRIPTGKDKTAITFELRNPNKPGSMRDVFTIFADAGINVSHHEAMEKGSLYDYVFWFNIDRHRDEMHEELARLGDLTIGTVLHGSYPRKT